MKKHKKEKGSPMELIHSKSGIPYIEFGSGRFIFSETTKDPERGYKYLAFVGGITNDICVSGARAKKKQYVKEHVPVNFTVDMNFKRDGKKGIPLKAKKILTNITLSWLQKKVQEYLVDGYFPETNISKLSMDIKKLNDIDDTEVDDFDDGDDETYTL